MIDDELLESSIANMAQWLNGPTKADVLKYYGLEICTNCQGWFQIDRLHNCLLEEIKLRNNIQNEIARKLQTWSAWVEKEDKTAFMTHGYEQGFFDGMQEARAIARGQK